MNYNDQDRKIKSITSVSHDGTETVENPGPEVVAALKETGRLSSEAKTAFQAGDLDRAEAYLLNSLSIERRLGLQSRMAADYGDLGAVYVRMGALPQAEDAIKKSLELGAAPVGRARNYYWYAHVYIKHKNLKLAEDMARKSYEIASGLDEPTAIGAKELLDWIVARNPVK